MADINRYYTILELEPGASFQDVKQAYRDLAFVWHPDRYSHNSRLQRKAQQRLKEINEAYEQLEFFLREPQAVYLQKAAEATSVGRYREPARSSGGGEKWSRDRWGDTYVSAPEPEFRAPTKLRIQKPFVVAFPWGWLTGAFSSYALTGWVLSVTRAPSWMWALAVGAAWLGIAILASEGSASQKAWIVALISAGGVGGLIAGNEAGGLLTGMMWAVAGVSLGAIAAMDADPRAVAGVVTLAGVVTVVGLIAGTEAGTWVGSVVGATIWGSAGLILGAIAETALKPRTEMGVGATLGLGVGSWSGAGVGAGHDSMTRAVVSAGSRGVFGAWVAIAIVAGVVAQIVAGEKLIEFGGGFYTFTILASISVLGLGLGGYLARWIF